MNLFVYRESSIRQTSAIIQIILLIIYLSLNIINIGEMGTGLLLLAIFFALSSAILLFEAIQGNLVVRIHFFLFLLYVAWIIFRVVVDLQDINYLKKITIATTGGVLLFFLIGVFIRWGMNEIIYSKNLYIIKFLIIIFLFTNALILQEFQGRLMDHTDIFLIEDIEGSYQRPGNFMVMLFIMESLAYLVIAAKIDTKKIFTLFFWLLLYSLSMVLNLINSQMIGSNAATALTAVIYLITVITSLWAFNKLIRKKYLTGQLRLLSRSVLKKIFKYFISVIFIILTITILLVQTTDIDFQKTRIFGFGSGENSSINSRFEILRETGTDQMGYAPIFGNLDVARLTTGDAGTTLHNFIPNILAALGTIGLLIVILLFLSLMRHLLKVIQNSEKNETGFIKSSFGLWIFLIFIFLFLYANISVGYEWPVMWFFVGFSTTIFSIKYNSRERKTCAAS